MNEEKKGESKYVGLRGLIDIVHKLRSEDGCPWDKKQTEETLKPFIIEEAYEVLEAIDSKNYNEISEELGDLLLQVIFLSKIYEEKGIFNIDDVIEKINEKLLRRHPHVFDSNFSLKEGECLEDIILKNWENIKKQEKIEKHGNIIKDKEINISSVYVSQKMPALHRSFMIQEKASRLGFDFPHIEDAFKKIYEETNELKEICKNFTNLLEDSSESDEIMEEYGDLLFSVVNIGRILGFHPCNALNKSSDKFIKRFNYIETKSNSSISALNPKELDDLWEESKKIVG
jgi:tetrapyrrole methylase family protein/MazG family protein